MAKTQPQRLTLECSLDEIQLAGIALHVLHMLLIDPSAPEIRHRVLSEVVHAQDFNGFTINLSSLLYHLDLESNEFDVLINKLHEVYHASH